MDKFIKLLDENPVVIIAPANTELKTIDIKTNFTDYTYYTEDVNYLHFQFQTTNKENDIKIKKNR